MPDYFQQAQPYNVGEAPNIAGALATGLQLRNQNRQLALQEMAGQREQKRFEIETDPEAMKRKQEAEILTLNSAQLAHLQNVTKYVNAMSSKVQWDPAQQDYTAFRNHMITEMQQMGVNPEQLATNLPESFGSQEEFDKWKTETKIEGMDLLKLTDLALKRKQLNEPGFEEKERIKAEIKAKAEAGKTSKDQYAMATIYGPDGQTKKVSVKKGEEYTPPEGWSLTKPVVEPRAKTIPTEAKASFARFDELKNTIGWIRKNIKSSMTGPIQGRWRSALSTVRDDPEFTEMKNKVARLRTIVYSESGKQINQSELDWLNKEILPKLSQPDANFAATLDAFENWLSEKEINLKGQYSEGYEGEAAGESGGRPPLNSFFKK